MIGLTDRQIAMKVEQRFWDTFGKRVKNARIAMGYESQREFQQALSRHGADIGISAISRIENDDILPSYPVLIAISKSLARSTDWLLGVPAQEAEPEPVSYTPEASEIAALIDSLPIDIKRSVVDEVRQLLRDRYDAFSRERRYNELVSLISERGGPDVLDSVRRILAKDNNNVIVRKGV